MVVLQRRLIKRAQLDCCQSRSSHIRRITSVPFADSHRNVSIASLEGTRINYLVRQCSFTHSAMSFVRKRAWQNRTDHEFNVSEGKVDSFIEKECH